jgi:hypothetical protein
VCITRGLLSLLPAGNAVLMLGAVPKGRILLFTIALSLLTGLILPARPHSASRAPMRAPLREAVGSVAGSFT